jgi:hypothetical protein
MKMKPAPSVLSFTSFTASSSVKAPKRIAHPRLLTATHEIHPRTRIHISERDDTLPALAPTVRYGISG